MRWLLLLTLFTGCAKTEKLEVRPRPVLVETVIERKLRPPLYFSGFSKAEKLINTSFRVPGMIIDLPILVGEHLRKGQLIARLDDTDFKLELLEKEAALEAAIAENRKTSAQYKRIKMLYESESASRDELDEARASSEGARAHVEMSRSLVDLARKQLIYTEIYAESDNCEVATKKAEINENVKSGETIATLTCGARLEVEIAVPETVIADIYVGEEVDVLFQALPGQLFKGIVREAAVLATGGTTFPVTVALKERSDELRSGMAAKVVIYEDHDDIQPQIILPIEAVGKDDKGNFVFLFVQTENGLGTPKKEYVTIGKLRPKGFTITDGLSEGDEVIIAGIRFLKDGRPVRKMLEFNIRKYDEAK
jgi:membrane fusion protein, multidrug efflux system